jgi:hypothetical protein
VRALIVGLMFARMLMSVGIADTVGESDQAPGRPR